MNGFLKDELGFQGFVLSDWQVQYIGVVVVVVGFDMLMLGDIEFNIGVSFWGINFIVVVFNGIVLVYWIDDMVMCIMVVFFKVEKSIELDFINFSFWFFDIYGFIYWVVGEGYQQINYYVDVWVDYVNFICEIVVKGIVFFKNIGFLFLNKFKFVVVIGEDVGFNFNGFNFCVDCGCNNGIFVMGWGFGIVNFFYFIMLDVVLQVQVIKDGFCYESILINYVVFQIRVLVLQDNVIVIVFVNVDFGEGYINFEGNMGDCNNLIFWRGGDDLVKNVFSWCSNIIVVIYFIGFVFISEWYDSLNIIVIFWVGFFG